jgi:hypothetical protein
MEMYSKLFYAKYSLSNIFTIISDMEINFEEKKKKNTLSKQSQIPIEKS